MSPPLDCLAEQASAQTMPVRDPDLAERAAIASAAYHAIRTYFAQAEGLPADDDFEARYHAYLREALTAPDRRNFSLATMRLFASLKNGHTGFFDEVMEREARPLPFTLRPVEGAWTILRSRLPVLSSGDVVIAVDGHPIDEWLEPIRAEIGQSSQATLDRVVWSRPFLFPSSFTLTLEDGREVPIDRAAPSDAPWRGLTLSKEVTSRPGPDGLVILRIPSFDGHRYEDEAITAIRAAKDARAILLDLRGNGGGQTPSRLLAAIMTRPYRGTSFVSPMTIALNDAQEAFHGTVASLPQLMMRAGADTTQPEPDAFVGKMAALVDGGCASACEDFVLRFQDGARGPVLGEATFGSTGQPFVQRFPEFGMSFRVSTKRETKADGQAFEGVGVTPDMPIPLTRSELREGVDHQLDQAIRLLSGS